ncbi:single-stranded DNA-binding protein [Clavibacter michiganensis]|uniref:single-stranded DNA-binding protein n=1 Tax=Clavibacter michiganensis TaxID=28447 RepID=UPI0026DB1982|nr:single-stranded DNA-binding protein [Clavibacter michiganensis]MDO4143959.1 single-stranded DNA-binding protein [Clavibacter michiganensis]
MDGEPQQAAHAHPPEWTSEQRLAYDLGRDVGYIEGRASRQADVDALDDLADRYYRAAYGDERRLQVGGISRAELEARRQQQPAPPEITREAALASWGLDPEPPPVEAPDPGDNAAPSTTPRTNRTSRRRAMTTRTITGRVAADPEAVQAGRVQIVKFRVLENTGEYRNGTWTEHPTPTTHHVEAKFELGANVLASLHTGDSVLVVGYEVTRTWEKEGKPRYGRVIEADAIGPNLAHSTTVITPQRRARATSTGE